MSRTAVYSALVLRNRSSGESNSEITLLTAEEGIIKTTVFGGAKSKLRAHSAAYNSGRVWVYRDKAKDYAKLSDFDVHSWRAGLRELYDRSMSAAAVAETILSSHGGGGEWAEAMHLAVSVLDALENANEELCEYLLIHFLWRWTDFLGIQPCIDSCAGCGEYNSNAQLWLNVREGTMLCAVCMKNSQLSALNSQQLNPVCRRWLSETGAIEPKLLHQYSMDVKSFGEAKALTAAVLAGAIGKRLKSWDW
jgi:DNA repair protein RecO (recombination protein O)